MKIETMKKLYEMGEWWEPFAAIGSAVALIVVFLLIYDRLWMRAWRRYLAADHRDWRGIWTRK